jgi:hypothetical protein
MNEHVMFWLIEDAADVPGAGDHVGIRSNMPSNLELLAFQFR